MANIKQQKKRNRQNEVRRVRNLNVRTELKTRIKTAGDAIDEGEPSAEAVRIAQKRLDTAAAKGTIHKRQASRRTSRLMKRAARSDA